MCLPVINVVILVVKLSFMVIGFLRFIGPLALTLSLVFFKDSLAIP